jgi:hypothetical protein
MIVQFPIERDGATERAHERSGSADAVEGYLTDREVAKRLGLAPKTLRNKVVAGIFREGEHFFRPLGMTRRWKWFAVVAWVERTQPKTPETTVIRLARSSESNDAFVERGFRPPPSQQ